MTELLDRRVFEVGPEAVDEFEEEALPEVVEFIFMPPSRLPVPIFRKKSKKHSFETTGILCLPSFDCLGQVMVEKEIYYWPPEDGPT